MTDEPVLKDVKGLRRIRVDDWYELKTAIGALGSEVGDYAGTLDLAAFKRYDTAGKAISDLACMYREAGDELMALAAAVTWLGETAPVASMDLMVVKVDDKKSISWMLYKLGEECDDYYVSRMRHTLNHAKSEFDVFYNLVGDLHDFVKKLSEVCGEMDYHAAFYKTVSE